MIKDNHINECENKIEFLLQINESLKQRLEGQKSGSIQCIVSKLDSLESLMSKDNYEINTLSNPDIYMRTEEGVELLNSVLSELSLVQPIIKEMLERNKELIKESIENTDSSKHLNSKIIPVSYWFSCCTDLKALFVFS